MNQKAEIVMEALAQLQEHTGITCTWTQSYDGADGEIKLRFGDKTFSAAINVSRELRNYQLPEIMKQAERHRPFMVIAEHIYPAIKEHLKAENIAYLDAAGNIFINDHQTYLWVDGRKVPQKTRKISNRAFTKAGLRVVFFLLLERNAINFTYRQLAEHTGVALGNIRNVLEGLKETGFILQVSKKEKMLLNKRTLLKRWIDGYRETLKPAMHLGDYRFLNRTKMREWRDLEIPDQVTAFWSGEPAAEEMTRYLTPGQLTLYVDNKAPLVSKWKLIPDPEGELRVYGKFWAHDQSKKDHLAPPLLVYADLLIADDPRCIETAEMIYKKYLENELETDKP